MGEQIGDDAEVSLEELAAEVGGLWAVVFCDGERAPQGGPKPDGEPVQLQGCLFVQKAHDQDAPSFSPIRASGLISLPPTRRFAWNFRTLTLAPVYGSDRMSKALPFCT